MSIRDDFFAAKAKGSLWDVAVSIKRGNPLPLDADSIFESYSALETYAADVLAYPGQVVAVVNTDSTGIYYLDQNLDIQPVGVIPTGDSKTIEVTEAGAISLLGAASAPNGTLPMIDSETGKLVWKTLEDIGAGDGNDNTTYEFSFANEKITVTPKFNGVAQTAVELDLSTFVTTEELAEELGKLVDNDTTYSVAEGEKVLKLNDTVFSTELGLKHENGKISLTGINGQVIAEFSDADFIKDSFLEEVEYDAETKKISFTWNTVDGETKTDEVDISDLVNTYEAANGIELTGNKFSVKIDSESESFLSVGANGVKLSGVQEAINSAASTAKSEAIADAATKYATTSALSQLETDLDARLDVLEAHDHSTYATKTELKATDDVAKDAQNRVDIVEGKIDEITSVGGEPNVLEKIKVNGVTLEVEKDSEGKSTKSVNIAVPTTIAGLSDWTSVDERITAAKNQADKGVSDASAADAKAANNTAEIAKHETRISNLEQADLDHEDRLLSLENADRTHAAEYSSLLSIVNGHTDAIAGKAAQSALDAVSQKASTNEQAIKTLNETTIPAINTEVAKKANSDNVYTKAQIGTIAENKTLVQMIEDAQAAATYNDTEVRGLISANAGEIARVEGLISAEAERANGVETTLSGRLDTVEAFWKEALRDSDEKNVIDTLKEIQNYIASDETGAAAMAASIQQNATAINGLAVDVEANTNAINAINDTTTGILALAKGYADEKVGAIPAATAEALGLVKYDNSTIKMNESKQLYVAKVSTDILEMGTQELILNGGSATV